MQQIDPMIVNTQDKQAIINMLLTSLNLGLTIIITINLTVYAFCLKNTPWAKNYLKGYAFTGAVLSVFEIIVYYTKLSTVNSITVITML
ncbi:MAG: hypothetical protein OEW87_10625, partial [Flavobacteriaceae bacterium]|nr:hypothetical protein [Flavobacteriaceae bacterium]